MQEKALVIIEWIIPFSLVGVIVVGTGWVMIFG